MAGGCASGAASGGMLFRKCTSLFPQTPLPLTLFRSSSTAHNNSTDRDTCSWHLFRPASRCFVSKPSAIDLFQANDDRLSYASSLPPSFFPYFPPHPNSTKCPSPASTSGTPAPASPSPASAASTSFSTKSPSARRPTLVAFGPKTRALGTDAVGSLTVNPKNTVSGLKRLLGARWGSPALEAELPRLPFEVVAGPCGLRRRRRASRVPGRRKTLHPGAASRDGHRRPKSRRRRRRLARHRLRDDRARLLDAGAARGRAGCGGHRGSLLPAAAARDDGLGARLWDLQDRSARGRGGLGAHQRRLRRRRCLFVPGLYRRLQKGATEGAGAHLGRGPGRAQL